MLRLVAEWQFIFIWRSRVDLSRDAIFNADFSACFMVTAFSSVIGDFVPRVSCYVFRGEFAVRFRILDLNYSLIFLSFFFIHIKFFLIINRYIKKTLYQAIQNFYKVNSLSINSLRFNLNKNLQKRSMNQIMKHSFIVFLVQQKNKGNIFYYSMIRINHVDIITPPCHLIIIHSPSNTRASI